MAKKNKAGFYAVAKGRSVGVYETWDECQRQVDGFAGAKHKKFTTYKEAKVFVDRAWAEAKGVHALLSAKDVGASSSDNAGNGDEVKAKRTIEALEKDAAHAVEGPAKKVAKNEENPSSSLHLFEGSADASAEVRTIQVYTDGASSNNGRPDARAGWGVHFPTMPDLDECKRLPGALQTNNRAELMGIIRAIQLNPDPNAYLHIFTDSRYSINALTLWQTNWRKNQWMRGKGAARASVLNKDLIRLAECEMRKCRYRPLLVYVKGHADSKENQRADQLAVQGAALPAIPEDEWVDLEPPPSDGEEASTVEGTRPLSAEEKEERREAEFAKARAYWIKLGFTPEQARSRAGG